MWQLGDWRFRTMGWFLRRFSLTKAVPLAISRGTTAQVEHLELTFSLDGCIGRGETGGFDTGHRAFSTDHLASELEALLPKDGATRIASDSLLYWSRCHPRPVVLSTSLFGIGGGNGWDSRFGACLVSMAVALLRQA